MSYCRWSSDNWMCDLYCYENSDGYITHVAGGRRTRGPKPTMAEVFKCRDSSASMELYKQHNADLETIEHKPIGLPHDGKSFTDSTLEEFKATVNMLKEAGYNVPDHVLEEIDDEIKHS